MVKNCDSKSKPSSVLMIYTGGTIGMVEDPKTGSLEPFDFKHLINHVPEVKELGYMISTIQFDPPLDSSEVSPESWVKMGQTIAENYHKYDGFVILHGTDTMAYTASALSFMLENLNKPVIITGSQLPIGKVRTDGKENLITAIEIAATKDDDRSMVREVCIYFQNNLMRGNRTRKMNADFFHAFRSFNYPILANVGIDINFNKDYLFSPNSVKPLVTHFRLDNSVVVLKLIPGISPQVIKSILTIPGIKGVVMETFGSGNAPCFGWFIDLIKDAISRGIVIVNITQCCIGLVQMKRYDTGHQLLDAGVISGFDSTTESAVTKLMYLFGEGYSTEQVKEYMSSSLIGEITV